MTQNSAQKTKNVRLLITLVVLIALTGVVTIWEPSGDGVSVDRELFAVADTASIDKVTITQGGETHTLSRTLDGWQLDNAYPAEAGVMQVFLSLVRDVRVFRPVSQRQTDSVRAYLQNEGYRVTLYDGDQVMQDWQVGGSERTSTSYFMPADGDTPFLVHLPGYRSYLAGLFQMPANDWRQRMVISVPFNLLNGISWDYTSDRLEDLTLKPSANFFKVEGVPVLDTATIVGVVREFAYFQTDYFIDQGDFPRFDSLVQTESALRVTVSPFDATLAQTLELWPLLPGDQYRLGRVGEDLLLLEDQRIRWLFLQPQNFAARPRRQRPGF